MAVMHLDYETRGDCPLPKTGVPVYVEHENTGIWIACWCIDDGPVHVWRRGDKLPKEFVDHIIGGGKVYAHNAQFEYWVWNEVAVNKHGWPPIRLDQIYCTAAMSYAMAIPASLEKAAKAVGLDIEKDTKGQRTMMTMMRPRSFDTNGKPIWWDDEEKMQTLIDYCVQDVKVERALEKRLLQLTPTERDVWVVDQKINNRGIKVGIEAVKQAIGIAETERERLTAELKKLTGGAVSTTNSVGQFKDWLNFVGIETDSVAKAAITEILAREDIPDVVRRACEIRQEAAKSSVSKYEALLKGTNADGRIRALMQYHAASTGRWGGRRFQPQNLPRPSMDQKDIDHVCDMLSKGTATAGYLNIFFDNTLLALSDCLRGMLVASPGKILVGCDYSSIEARVLAWLAGEERVIRVFETHGKLYEHAASGIFGVPLEEVTKEQRQIGKVAVLALGYGGGVGAFQSMAKGYGLKIADKQAEDIKKSWRENHKATVQYWRDLEGASISAVRNPGQQFAAGAGSRRVIYVVKGSFLFCKLPSGRVLTYPYPKLKDKETPWGTVKECLVYKTVSSQTYRFQEVDAYGGLLAENVTQAVSRDILAEALLRLERGQFFETVLHVHDEVLCEADESLENPCELMETIMNEKPKWADGLPIQSEAWTGKRYQK